ncbi:hypothetical protein L579_1922 [Pantoea sp. AS-PWVM4]|uniref:hypothetical protein n=1 Tax=Pantoea sp. AS-PWVM4 TaxID=1332069 RepID=UPI0003AC6584|nr:hypothetical protein [Pantoea sp. AS-PWVM4]ERK18598.1 hypothetical protein L579_1922 [Pantoea sp. AS-PWVM4]
MKVKSIGFEIENPNQFIKTGDVLAAFIQASRRVHSYTDSSRQILMSEEPDYYVGMVLTYRNQKKNCKSTFSGGKFRLKVEDLKGSEKLVSFNFFCLKKSNLKGLYLYHHSSCSINSLFSNFQTISNDYIRSVNKKEIDALGEKPKKKDVIAVNKKYKERFNFKILTTQSSIEAILAQFKKIKSASFRFSHLQFEQKPMSAIETITKNIDINFSIDNASRSKTSNIGRLISDAYGSVSNILKAKVVALDYNDNERFIDVMNCPTFFDEYDFDLIADKVDGLTNDNYSSSEVIDIIKDQIMNGKNKNVFI